MRTHTRRDEQPYRQTNVTTNTDARLACAPKQRAAAKRTPRVRRCIGGGRHVSSPLDCACGTPRQAPLPSVR
eukprot:2206651-Prymnesium_polylepis.1